MDVGRFLTGCEEVAGKELVDDVDLVAEAAEDVVVLG